MGVMGVMSGVHTSALAGAGELIRSRNPSTTSLFGEGPGSLTSLVFTGGRGEAVIRVDEETGLIVLASVVSPVGSGHIRDVFPGMFLCVTRLLSRVVIDRRSS